MTSLDEVLMQLRRDQAERQIGGAKSVDEHRALIAARARKRHADITAGDTARGNVGGARSQADHRLAGASRAPGVFQDFLIDLDPVLALAVSRLGSAFADDDLVGAAAVALLPAC